MVYLTITALKQVSESEVLPSLQGVLALRESLHYVPLHIDLHVNLAEANSPFASNYISNQDDIFRFFRRTETWLCLWG